MSEKQDNPLHEVDPFDPSRFAVTATAAALSAKKELTACKVGKPNKTQFVRASDRPEDTMPCAVLELKEQGEVYLLMPEVAEHIPSLAKFVMLTVSTDRQGNIFLWMVNQPSRDGRPNSWTTSGQMAIHKAKEEWVRVEANMASGSYDVYTAPVGVADPVWPGRKINDYLKVAFGDSVVNDVGHPVIQRLLGLA